MLTEPCWGRGQDPVTPPTLPRWPPRTNRKLCLGLQDQQGAGLVSEVFKVELKDPEAGSIQRVDQSKKNGLFPAETIHQESTWTLFKALPDEDSAPEQAAWARPLFYLQARSFLLRVLKGLTPNWTNHHKQNQGFGLAPSVTRHKYLKI